MVRKHYLGFDLHYTRRSASHVHAGHGRCRGFSRVSTTSYSGQRLGKEARAETGHAVRVASSAGVFELLDRVFPGWSHVGDKYHFEIVDTLAVPG